jgi:hypothetical protein
MQLFIVQIHITAFSKGTIRQSGAASIVSSPWWMRASVLLAKLLTGPTPTKMLLNSSSLLKITW